MKIVQLDQTIFELTAEEVRAAFKITDPGLVLVDAKVVDKSNRTILGLRFQRRTEVRSVNLEHFQETAGEQPPAIDSKEVRGGCV